MNNMPSKKEQEETIAAARAIIQKSLMEAIKKYPTWMRCNLLLNNINAGKLIEEGHTVDEINAMVDWEKVNEILSQFSIPYDYNLFGKVSSIEELEAVREGAYTTSIIDDWPSYKQTCKQCGDDFTMSRKEINWFINKGMKVPCRCYHCRKGLQKPKTITIPKQTTKKKEPEKTSMQIAMEKAGLI